MDIEKIDPQRISFENLAAYLSKISPYRVTEKMILADVSEGAPINPDGTIRIFDYLAWLLKTEK